MSKTMAFNNPTLTDFPSTSNMPSAAPLAHKLTPAPRLPTLLLGIGTAVPANSATQEQASDFLQNVMSACASEGDADSQALLGLAKRIYAHSGIETRYSVIDDYTKTDADDFTFFPKSWTLNPVPGTTARMAKFEEHAVELAAEAAEKAFAAAGVSPEQVTHLVISTCTGFFAPGPDVLLLRRLGMATTTARTVLGFMGCYAGISGVRACHQIVQSDPDAVVLQIAVELCTLHYQKKPTPDTIVSTALFADGAAAAVYAGSPSVSTAGAATAPVQVLATHSDISPDSLDRMSWRVGDHGFIMTLDAKVPSILRDEAPAFIETLAKAGGMAVSDISGWAIHPGGRKIVESLQQIFDLSAEDVSSSTNVLRDYGNMSSATILFVLQEELARAHPSGSPIAAMAFGPGLTMEGALFVAG